MMNTRHTLVALLLASCATLPAWAQDRADIDRTQIIGNRELPKVLYIVPWKKPLPAELSGRPDNSVLDEAMRPIDRDVFRREARYLTMAQAHAKAAASANAPTDVQPDSPAAAPKP